MEEDEFIDPDAINREEDHQEGPIPSTFDPSPNITEPVIQINERIEDDEQLASDQEGGVLRRLRNLFRDQGIREELQENPDTIFSEGNYFTTLIDRHIHKRHCPYCFEYVVKRIYRDQPHNRNGKIVDGIPLRLGPTRIHVCSACDRDLPSDFFQSKSSSIAVIGGREAGKSTFITVFCELLLNHKSVLDELGIFGHIINEDGKNAFRSNQISLIKRGLCLDGTKVTQPPIVVRLENKHHKEVIYLTFIDAAGEIFENPDQLIEKFPSIQLAEGIIFLMNPLDIGGIKDLMQEENPRGQIKFLQRLEVENFDIIQNLYQLYVTTRRIKANKTIKIPSVFCLTKADMLEDLASLYLPSDFEPNLVQLEDVIQEMKLVSEDLLHFLDEVDKRLLNLIEKRFANFSIFPVSALGKMPESQGRNLIVREGVDPKGVLQPLLWILLKTKFIR